MKRIKFLDGGDVWFYESDDYHEATDGENYERWFEKVLPLSEKNVVIVLNNAC